MNLWLVKFYAFRIFVGIIVCLLGKSLLAQEASLPLDRSQVIYAAEVDVLIHPVSAEYIIQTIARADAEGAALVVLRLETPGGLVDSTREINSAIIAAKTPVVVYVGPSGTRAASAGFLITIAADVAVMAPGTHIGAAHPVSGTGAQMDETQAEKAASDVAAYARSLAAQRNRNVQLAQQAVIESQSFTEEEALHASPPLIDFIATDLDDLLKKLDGKTITRWDGSTTELSTLDAFIVPVEMNWRQRLLSAIAHPQVAVLLFSLGTLGLTIELWNPGAIVPGVVGGLSLLLAFFAFQILPINYAGLLLIAFGFILLVCEMLVTSYGLLAVGGIVGVFLGSLILIDSPVPELQLGLPFIVSITLALTVIVLFLVRIATSAQLRRSPTGPSGMIDEVGSALTSIDIGGAGRVLTHGEIWTATSNEFIPEGESVYVTAVDGMKLTVKRITLSATRGKLL